MSEQLIRRLLIACVVCSLLANAATIGLFCWLQIQEQLHPAMTLEAYRK